MLDLGGLVLWGVVLMLACIIILRQRLGDRNGVAALDALMILQAAVGCIEIS